MTRWTAIVPYNHGRPRKTRLAARYDAAARAALALAMARHVVGVLGHAPGIARIALLSPERPPLPGDWIADGARGLNAELAAAAEAAAGPVLILHADLPLLVPADIAAMLDAGAGHAAAIAPDEAGAGTNALALLSPAGMVPAFGADSFARHRARLPHAAIVTTPGLAHDIDDADSLDRAARLGWSPPPA